MLLSYDYLQTLTLLWAYVLIYNLSILPLFSALFQLTTSNIKTFNYFSSIGVNSFLTKVILISFLSAAGIPPFVGFFSKIFIFTLLCNSNFAILFLLLFLLLFISLYFYMQNIRFLNTSNPRGGNVVFEKNIRLVLNFYYLTLPNTLFLLLGFLVLDDLFILIKWFVV